MRHSVKILAALISILVLPGIFAVPALGEMLTVTLDAGDYEITEDEEGLQRIIMEGFGSLSQPGEPWLPGRVFYIALPPLAEVYSVTVEGIAPRELPGTYQLAPRPAMLPWTVSDRAELRNFMEEWEDRRRDVYESDAPYPKETGRLDGTGGLRKYTFARVSFTPFIYLPRSGRLTHYSSARVIINYTAPGMTDEVQRLLSDRKMEDRAVQLLVNYKQAQHWYPRVTREDKAEDWDYVIIATDSMSASCDTLIDWKEDLGYDVKVVTTTWITSNYTGADLPARIRNFLRDKYIDSEWGIEYVLIAGDDDHIPMRRCHPFADTTAFDTPTDYYYADLSQADNLSWDSDGDGLYGERWDDAVDWVAEVYVGRILSNNADNIHDICKKMVKFEKEDASFWKYDALLIGSVGWYANEDTSGGPKMDCAELMEDVKNDMLQGAGWSWTRMYEKAGLDTCPYLCEIDLTRANVLSDWPTGTYGIVNWFAHGGWNRAIRKWWATDDGDGIPENDAGEISKENFIQNSDAPTLDDEHPSIVYANSCLCGQPETNCLAQTLLSHGASGVIAATRVSYGPSTWDDPSDGGIGSMDYYFFDELLNHDKKLGEALLDAKVRYSAQHMGGWWDQRNMYDFCLYGDPSMIWQGAIPVADTISNDTVWTASQSPYIVENRLYIRGTDGGDNVTTLTINPGVRVVFGEDGALVVGSAGSTRPGALVADGKPDSLIVFTSASDTTKNEPDDWLGLEFLDYSKDATCKLDYCLIEYPRDGIYCHTASPTISNCLIRNVYRHGICLYSDSDPTITNTVVHDCGQVGIRLSTNCDPTMYGDSVATCRHGLFIEYGSPSVDSCFFMDNTEDGVSISGATAGPTISNCVAQDNGSAGIDAYNSSIPIISGCQVSYNSIWGIILSGVDGGQVYGNTVTYHDSIAGIEIQGANDTVWVYSNRLSDNYGGLFLNYCTSSSPTAVYYNTIEDNEYGVSIEDTASISIHHNDILDNNVLNLNYGPLDTLVAEYNWWGSTNTATIEAKLGGYGQIDYKPFLTNTYHAPWVEVVSPNGGEVFADTSNITWVAPDVDGDSVEIAILYSADGGINWWVVADHEENDSLYAWDTTPRDDGTQYMIKLQAYDGTYTSWDTSDAVFTIYNPDPPQVTVTYPNGGELLLDSTDITWTATDPDVGDSTILSVDLEYSPDAGSTWTYIDSNQANDGVYGWSVFDLDDGTEYLIRIAVTDTSGLFDEDTSDAVFEINNLDPPSVTVLSPNGSEHWSGTHDIIWTASDPDSLEGLTFDLLVGIATTSDTTWTILDSSLTDTSYVWNTTGYSDWHTWYAKVVVTDPDTLTDEDLSNTSFTVDNTPPPMPSYLHLDAYWDPVLGLGSADLSWEDVTDTLSPPETFKIYHGTSDTDIDYDNPIEVTGVPSCTIDSLSTGPHYFGLSVHDAADTANRVIYQKSKGTNGEGVYFTTGADANLASVVPNSNGVVTGSSPNFNLNGSLVLTYPNIMLINYENLTAGDSDGHHALKVYGRLSAHKSTFSAASAGDWQGIVFADSSMDYDTTAAVGCLVDSCTIRHAINGIYCHFSSPMINGNEISHCSTAGINCFWSGAFILNNDAAVGGIHHNGCGIFEDGEGPSGRGIIVEYNEVRDNTLAGMHHGAQARPSLYRNLIHDNSNGAEFESWASPIRFERNDIYGNSVYGVLNDTINFVQVTATLNWWGDESGPSGIGSGSGDAVSNNVTYKPFLSYPSGGDVVNWCQLISPDSINMDVGDTTQTILGQVYEPGITPGAGQGAGITAQVGYGSNNSEPCGTAWNWTAASYVQDVGNNDEYGGTLTVSRSGTYDFAYRFSMDSGTTWVYADLDGNNTGGGSSNGYTSDQAGHLQVGWVLNPVIVIDDDWGPYQGNYTSAAFSINIRWWSGKPVRMILALSPPRMRTT
jgi:parallel beta-helix repeat protein